MRKPPIEVMPPREAVRIASTELRVVTDQACSPVVHDHEGSSSWIEHS
jgi:hypothetical protein